MRAQTILFLLVDRVKGKLNCRPYRGGGEGNPKRLVEAASVAFSNRSNILTIRGPWALVSSSGKWWFPTRRSRASGVRHGCEAHPNWDCQRPFERSIHGSAWRSCGHRRLDSALCREWPGTVGTRIDASAQRCPAGG